MKFAIQINLWLAHFTLLAILTLAFGIKFIMDGHWYGILLILCSAYFVWGFYQLKLQMHMDNQEGESDGV